MGVLQANQKSSIAPDGESRATCSVDWSPNEDRFAMGGKSKILRVVSTDGKQQWSGSGHTDWIRALRWAPEGGFIVTGSDDRTARIWDESSGKCTKTLKGGHSELRRPPCNRSSGHCFGAMTVAVCFDNRHQGTRWL